MEVLVDPHAESYKAAGPPILLVDDSPEDSESIARALTQIGCFNPVYRFACGEDAVDFLFRTGRFSKPGVAPRPDVVILDLYLPDMTGLDVLYEIRRHPMLRGLPVVVVSGSTDPDAERECLEAGANDFLHKPADPRGLAEMLRAAAHCWVKGGSGKAGGGGGGGGGGSPSRHPPASSRQVPKKLASTEPPASPSPTEPPK